MLKLPTLRAIAAGDLAARNKVTLATRIAERKVEDLIILECLCDCEGRKMINKGSNLNG